MRGGVTRVSTLIEFTEIDDIKSFYVAGKKYNCTLVDEGFSDPDD
jgi:hypothetical protein